MPSQAALCVSWGTVPDSDLGMTLAFPTRELPDIGNQVLLGVKDLGRFRGRSSGHPPLPGHGRVVGQSRVHLLCWEV